VVAGSGQSVMEGMLADDQEEEKKKNEKWAMAPTLNCT
jgi:hypothetical protein